MHNETLSSLYFISGSFRSLSLFLLAFSPFSSQIRLIQTIPAFGPHQYLATNSQKDRIYATSWSVPPVLSAWRVFKTGYPLPSDDVDVQAPYEAPGLSDYHVSHLGNTLITAVSSYITVPPPFTHTYSCGGPTGEVYKIEPDTGVLGSKIQQLLFVEEDQLESADKTRKALRLGSHGIEFSNTPDTNLAFVPVLNTDSIEVYTRDSASGELTHIYTSPSPRRLVSKSATHPSSPPSYLSNTQPEIDGPRHVKTHPNGRILYCVTEHSNVLDVYAIIPPPASSSAEEWTPLKHVSSHSLLPPSSSDEGSHKFRGDTLLLHPPTPSQPTPTSIFLTTRGGEDSTRGWMSVFMLDETGMIVEDVVERYECPTSGGKAHALDLFAKELVVHPNRDNDASVSNHRAAPMAPPPPDEVKGVYILLTDDSDAASVFDSPGYVGGGVKVLEWNGFGTGGVRELARWPGPNAEMELVDGQGERFMGGSHAVWLT